MLWTTAVLLALCALVVLANTAVLRSGNARVRASIDELAPAPVAIVLGAAVKRDGTPSHALEDRLQQALELYRAGKVKKLLLSGDHGAAHYDETNTMRRWMQERGVPGEDLFCDHAGFSTYDTFARAKCIFGVERAIVVTQRFHLARALYTAQEFGIDAQGTPCDRRTYRKGAWFEVRELGSRTKACIQAGWLKPDPQLLGPPIPIEGDGRVSWDRLD